MTIRLDHLILPVNDLDESVEFYTAILGLWNDGVREPFSIIRVTPDFALQLGDLLRDCLRAVAQLRSRG